MKLFFSLAFVVISYLVYGFLVAQYDINQISKNIESQHPIPFYDYKGVTNVYSNLSIGSGDYQEIIEAGKISGLDFIFITDLNVLGDITIIEGYHDNLLVLQASKFSYLDSRLLYYSKEIAPPAQTLGELQVKLSDLLSQDRKVNKDLSLVLTHPSRKGFSWSGEIPPGLDGVEVINYKSVQQAMWEKDKLSSLLSLLIYPFNQNLAFIRLFEDPDIERSYWDKLNLDNMTTGHLGLEATGKAIPYTGKTINFPSYQTIFSLGAQHVILKSELTGNVNNDKLKILRALKNGEFYFSLDVLGDPKGFNTFIKEGEKSYLMGSVLKLNKGMTLNYNLPKKPYSNFEVVLIKNGSAISQSDKVIGSFPIQSAGTYRLLVTLSPNLPFPDKSRKIPWIYSNPFLIK